MSEIKIKPCPFCGGTDLEVRDADKYTDAEVVCMNDSCGASVAYGKTRDAAVAVWNRRAAPEPAPDDRERAKEFESSLNAFSERKDVRERLAAEFARVRAEQKERDAVIAETETLTGDAPSKEQIARFDAAYTRDRFIALRLLQEIAVAATATSIAAAIRKGEP